MRKFVMLNAVDRHKPDTPEHKIRARLSEVLSDGVLDRLGDGFYDVYAQDEEMTSIVSHPHRCQLWGSSHYRGNCDGRLMNPDLMKRCLPSLRLKVRINDNDRLV